MARRSKPNRKRTPRVNLAARARTAAIALALGALSSFGLWRCLDEDPSAAAPEPSAGLPLPAIDLGASQEPDPTLVNEMALLQAEEPEDPDTAAAVDDADKAEIDAPEQQQEEQPAEDVDAQAELEERFPLHAVAYHFHTQIMAEPAPDARVIGYARRGSTFRVSERVGTSGCRRGWHELPEGGFLCDGAGAKVAREPVTFAPAPPRPRLDAPLPYDYYYAREDDTPEFWRLPTAEELDEAARIFKRLRARDEGRLPSTAEGPARLGEALARAASIAAEQDGGVADGGVAELPAPEPEPTPTPPTVAADGGAAPDPFALPPYVHLRMAKGYFVSADDKVASEQGDYRRTVRGRFVPEQQLFPAKPTSFAGVLLGRQVSLPLTFVVGGGVKLLKQEGEDGPFKTDRKVSRYEHLPYLGVLKRKGRRYVQVGEGLYLPARTAAVAELAEPPAGLLPGERWIDVNLRQQTLVAYEGTTPVFATLISSGRRDFDTPEGSFRIYGKHVTITMDDPDGGAEAYSIEDVPWTQYFEEGYALHAAFWHDRFGRVRSHGCINLSPADARRLFFWTGPHLPDGLHGIVATRENPGTRVVIHK